MAVWMRLARIHVPRRSSDWGVDALHRPLPSVGELDLAFGCSIPS